MATWSSCLAVVKEGEREGSSFRVTLAGRAGSKASMGARIQWDSRHSGFTLKTNKRHKDRIKHDYFVSTCKCHPVA